MTYKLFNTGNTDQQIPLRHGVRREGIVGSAGQLPSMLNIPGKARVSEGKNFAVVEEDKLRTIFGLYAFSRPGVFNRDKPCDIKPSAVKMNTKLLDSGRIIVVDQSGRHILGIGGAAYQKNTLDNAQAQNAMLLEQQDRFTAMLIDELGMTPEDAATVVKNKQAGAQGILKKYKGVIGSGMDTAEKNEDTADKNEMFTIFVGDDMHKEYKTEDGAIKGLNAMAKKADAEVVVVDDVTQYTDVDGKVVRVG